MSRSNKGILLESGTNEVEFLLFHLGSQRYGINVSKVCQILLFDPKVIAEIPNQQKDVIGVMTFRNRSISVIDLRKLLNTKMEDRLVGRELLLVAQFNQRTMGFVVDSVDRIERCGWDEFEPIAEITSNNTAGNVVGMVTLKEGIVLILDLESLIGEIDPSMTMNEVKLQSLRSGSNRSKVSIVSCEDSAVVQHLLVKTLKLAGFSKIHTFPTGVAGLDFIANSNSADIDIIITDIEMPSMDGLTLCKQIRGLPGFETKPLIFFSSMIDDQMKVKCQSVGGDAAFSKPQIDLIIEEIDALVNRQSS